MELKGLKKAGTALIFGRGAGTLKFILKSQVLALHLSSKAARMFMQYVEGRYTSSMSKPVLDQ